MKERILSLLGIEPGEESMITTLLTQSIFLGIFFGAFDISAHSLFLSIFDEKKMAQGYVVSGMAGIILTTLYTQFQNRMKFRKFSVFNLAFVTLVTLLLWIVLLLNPSKWVIFIVFVMFGPLNILAMLGFWGTVSRLFTIRQGKRLFSLVDSGLVVGMIISCYSIPVVLSFGFRTHDILLVSASAVIVSTILQLRTGSRFLLPQQAEPDDTSSAVSRNSIIGLIKENSYVRLLGIFIALSVMTAFFVQYSFMAVTREQYPAEADMARFLGLFTGSMMIFTLLVKLAAFAYIIRNYGLRTCLALSPLIILGLTVAAVLIGSLMGFTPLSGGFLLFFLIMALSRLFSKSLKDSIESPSFKVIYLTFDEKTRYIVQSGMDGTINEIAALSSGLLLTVLGLISSVKLIHFPVVLLLIAGSWVIVAFRVYSGYRKSIRRALETEEKPLISAPEDEVKEPGSQAPFLDDMAIRENYYNLVKGNFTVIEKSCSDKLRMQLLDHAAADRDIALIPLARFLSASAACSREVKEKAGSVLLELEKYSGQPGGKDDKTLLARKLLLDTRPPQTTQILRLLRDNSVTIRSVGMMLIGKFRMKDMVQEVCEGLENPALRSTAFKVLSDLGPDARDQLQRYYMISAGNVEISRAILRILASEKSEESNIFLFSRLWSNSRIIKEEALDLLLKNNFRCPAHEKDHIHQLISDVIGILTWNLAAKISADRNGDQSLAGPLSKETERWNLFLFGLLSVTYDSGSISRIRENLESGTVGSVNFALEMIDMVIDESLKPKLIPLLDVVPDETKVKNLFNFYPGDIPEFTSLVDGILNRDYNLLGIWIRASALRNITALDNETLAESVKALLFSPELILQEEAARLTARSERDIFESVSGRIKESLKEKIEKFMFRNAPSPGDVFEKTEFLSAVFKGTNEETLISLASRMIFSDNPGSASASVPGGLVVWPCGSGDNPAIFRNSDEAGIKLKHEAGAQGYYILPLKAAEEFNYQEPERSKPILDYIAGIRN